MFKNGHKLNARVELDDDWAKRALLYTRLCCGGVWSICPPLTAGGGGV